MRLNVAERQVQLHVCCLSLLCVCVWHFPRFNRYKLRHTHDAPIISKSICSDQLSVSSPPSSLFLFPPSLPLPSSSLRRYVGGHLNAFNGRCGRRRLRALTVKMPKVNTCKTCFGLLLIFLKIIYSYYIAINTD